MGILISLLICNYDQVAARNKIDSLLLEKIDLDRSREFLLAKKDLSTLEASVLRMAGAGLSSRLGAEAIGIPVKLYKRLFLIICEKVNNFLGAEYSDASFFRKIKPKLSPDEIEEMTKSLTERELWHR